MPDNTVRTIGIIRLADGPTRSEPDTEPRDLASTLKWLAGDTSVSRAPTRQRFRADAADKLQPAMSVGVNADLDTIYSQLEDELLRLTAC